MRNRRPSWSSASSSACCRATNCSRSWPSSCQPSRHLPHSRARRPATRSKPNAPRQRWLPAQTRLPRPMERQLRILQSPRRAKTEETPTCEMSVLLHVYAAGQLSCSVTHYPLEILHCWINKFISHCVPQVAAMENICYTVFGVLAQHIWNNMFTIFPCKTQTHIQHKSWVAAVADICLLLFCVRLSGVL